METNEVTGRQYPLYALATLDADHTSPVINLPPGAVTVGGHVRIGTVGAVSLKVTVKDNADTPVSLFGDVAADATGATAMTTTGLGLSYAAGGKLTVAPSAADADVVAAIAVAYVVNGRVNELYSA